MSFRDIPITMQVDCSFSLDDGQALTQNTQYSCGLDFKHIGKSVVIPVGSYRTLKTGIRWTASGHDIFAEIRPRSSTAVIVDVLGGIIDSDYTGEWEVRAYNRMKQPLTIKSGCRYFQIIVQRYVRTIHHNSDVIRGDASTSVEAAALDKAERIAKLHDEGRDDAGSDTSSCSSRGTKRDLDGKELKMQRLIMQMIKQVKDNGGEMDMF